MKRASLERARVVRIWKKRRALDKDLQPNRFRKARRVWGCPTECAYCRTAKEKLDRQRVRSQIGFEEQVAEIRCQSELDMPSLDETPRTDPACPFCRWDKSQIVLANRVGIAFRDAYPLSRGHTLVVPRDHVSSLFDLPVEVQTSLWELVADVRGRLQEALGPDGFNIGVNDGWAAGQTVSHVHIHVIPRYTGDVADPRGGIRWVIPEKARYWQQDTR